jgi:hypothetical protein
MMTSELDWIIRRSLEDLAREVFSAKWFGRERELVSLYAFGHLLRYCRPGHVLHHPAQIVLDGAVPQNPGPNRKPQVCKDLVLWSEPGMTCWSEEREPVWHPLAILEWKANRTRVSRYDVDWLSTFSRDRDDFLGYAVCLDLKQRRFRLSCTRVKLGEPQPGWLVVPNSPR